MIRAGLAALLVAYAPGALLYRLPFANRARRAALDAEERVFWHVILSVAWSLAVVLALASFGAYRFERLLIANAILSGAVVLAGRGGLIYRGEAKSIRWTVVLPLALVVIGLVRFQPTSEYIIGGKDPGTYINEGIQIAQRGSIVIHDPVVAAVPPALDPLFFPRYLGQPYDSVRFMGFFVEHTATGEVTGQLPHGFPASIAIGYGLDGLTGARLAVAAWAILGLVALYVFAARLAGPITAFAAAALLAVHVIELWFARYPNSEIALQALVFATLLAFTRAHQDDDAFFAPVAGVLATLLIFTRLDGLLVAAGLAATMVLTWIVTGTRPRVSFLITLVIGLGLALAYLMGPLQSYLITPIRFTDSVSRGLTWLAVGRWRRGPRDARDPAAPVRRSRPRRRSDRAHGRRRCRGRVRLVPARAGRAPDRLRRVRAANVHAVLPVAGGARRRARRARPRRDVVLLARAGVRHRVRGVRAGVLLQDSRRARALLDGAARAAGHPAGRVRPRRVRRARHDHEQPARLAAGAADRRARVPAVARPAVRGRRGADRAPCRVRGHHSVPRAALHQAGRSRSGDRRVA